MIFKKQNSTKRSDEELMLAMANGNQNAFSELYNRYNERLYYFFYRMLGCDRELANDFLQDIFLKLIHKPELFKTEHKFSSWIFSVAHNMCKNEYRNRDVRKILQKEENPDKYYNLETTESEINKEKLIAHVFTELETLEESQRSVLILKYKENFSLKEISEILELPLGTIKSRLHYARLELAKKIEKKELL